MRWSGGLVLALSLAAVSLAVHARVYRWVDDRGNVQYSDAPPPSSAKGVAELDRRGMVRKKPEKASSAAEAVRFEEEKQARAVLRRRDQALLQSFSRPEEIDYLRDRQIEAVNARVQTNKLQRRTVEDRAKRLNAQIGSLAKAGKPVSASVKADLEGARKELGVLDGDASKMDAEIADIRTRAEADKKRLLELRSAATGRPVTP